ncbi:MAG TPA: hypothetical protein VF222_08405 [Nitrososphaeraceae archaeon]
MFSNHPIGHEIDYRKNDEIRHKKRGSYQNDLIPRKRKCEQCSTEIWYSIL